MFLYMNIPKLQTKNIKNHKLYLYTIPDITLNVTEKNEQISYAKNLTQIFKSVKKKYTFIRPAC